MTLGRLAIVAALAACGGNDRFACEQAAINDEGLCLARCAAAAGECQTDCDDDRVTCDDACTTVECHDVCAAEETACHQGCDDDQDGCGADCGVLRDEAVAACL